MGIQTTGSQVTHIGSQAVLLLMELMIVFIEHGYVLSTVEGPEKYKTWFSPSRKNATMNFKMDEARWCNSSTSILLY